MDRWTRPRTMVDRRLASRPLSAPSELMCGGRATNYCRVPTRSRRVGDPKSSCSMDSTQRPLSGQVGRNNWDQHHEANRWDAALSCRASRRETKDMKSDQRANSRRPVVARGETGQAWGCVRASDGTIAGERPWVEGEKAQWSPSRARVNRVQ